MLKLVCESVRWTRARLQQAPLYARFLRILCLTVYCSLYIQLVEASANALARDIPTVTPILYVDPTVLERD
jgi:hypothetical protein